MAKKQTYAKVMKDLTSKKAKYEAGLEEAQRLGSASGIADYQRRLAKLSAGMDELFQAQEASKAPKMAKGGMTDKQAAYATGGPLPKNMPPMLSFNQGGFTSNPTPGGWYIETVPNDGSNPQAFVNSEGNYVLIRNKDGRATVMTPEMARIVDSDNPGHLFFKLDQGDYDMNFIKNSWDNTESVDYNNPDTQDRLLEDPNVPTGHYQSYESEMPAYLQQELGYAGPSVNQMLTNPDFGQATGPSPVQTGVAGPVGAREAAQLGGKIFDTDPTFTDVNLMPAAEVAGPAPTNAAGTQPGSAPLGLTPISPLREMQMQSLHNKINARSVGAMETPTWNVGDLTDPNAKTQGFRSKVEDAAMNVGGVGQKLGNIGGGMSASTKAGIGMALGAAAQFIPDIAAMRAMDRIEAPEDRPMERLQLMNADLQVGNQLAQIQNQAANAQAAADRNVSNPAVAAAMKRANQRIAAGQAANVLAREAEVESQLRNQNMMLANDNMNRNRLIDYGNRQQAIDFENEKLAAKNRMRQQMGLKLGQVAGDFQNMYTDKMRWDILSKGFDPELLGRNDLDWNSLFGTTNSND